MDKLLTLAGRFTCHARVSFDDTEGATGGQLYFVRKGPVTFTHPQAPALLVEDATLVFYPRRAPHAVQAAAGADLARATISFTDGQANPLADAFPERLHIALQDAAPLRHALELLFAETVIEAPGSDVILDRLSDVLMIQMLRHEVERGSLTVGMLAGLGDRQLSPVLLALHQRPHEAWQLRSMAGLAGMSRTGFAEHFRRVIGTPPGEYLSRWRIGLACRLLREGLPVKVVSARAGYASAAAFSRAFAEHTGASPRHWLARA